MIIRQAINIFLRRTLWKSIDNPDERCEAGGAEDTNKTDVVDCVAKYVGRRVGCRAPTLKSNQSLILCGKNK